VVGLAYTLLIGIPACSACMCMGLLMVGVAALLIASLVFVPVGPATMAAGMTTMTLGARYLALDARRF
jgi:hypothetical protein